MDANHAGPGVTADGLKRYIEVHTPRVAAAHGHAQTAQVTNGLPSDPPTVFGAAPAEGQVEIVVAPGATPGTLVVEGAAGEAARVSPPPAVWSLRLPRGTWYVTDGADGIVGRFRVQDTTEVLHVRLGS